MSTTVTSSEIDSSSYSSTENTTGTSSMSGPRTVAVLFARGGLGDVGRQAVRILLERGIHVRAISRHVEDLHEHIEAVTQLDSIPRESKLLTKIQCNYEEEGNHIVEQLESAFEGADGVISCIGCRQPGWESFQRPGLTKIVSAMRNVGVTRLVSMSSMGINEDYPGGKWVTWISCLWRCMMWTCIRRNKIDITAGEDIVKASGLDYVLVRPVGIPADALPGGGSIELPARESKGMRGGRKCMITMAKEDVAQYMIDQIFQPTRHQEAVTLSRLETDAEFAKRTQKKCKK